MKKFLIAAWLLVPALLVAYHYGPGQDGLARDDASVLAAEAEILAAGEDWANAIQKYEAAIEALPEGDKARRQELALARSQAKIEIGQIPDASFELESLLDELKASDVKNPELTASVQETLAETQFYITWLMRLEGANREDWKPYAESSRQHYRHLAENAEATGDSGRAAKLMENLESAIKLARMDLSDLQALPLPKQCKACKNCSGQCKGGKKPGKKPSNGKKLPQDSRSAGEGRAPDSAGS